MDVNVQDLKIGQYADYVDTGIWAMKDGQIVAPEDLTIQQLKDFLLATGGGVYLRQDGRFVWARLAAESSVAGQKEG